LARAISSDLALYNEDKIAEGIRNDNLFDVMADEVQDGRDLYQSRVAPELMTRNLYDRAIIDL
jgi:hypothetical protein